VVLAEKGQTAGASPPLRGGAPVEKRPCGRGGLLFLLVVAGIVAVGFAACRKSSRRPAVSSSPSAAEAQPGRPMPPPAPRTMEAADPKGDVRTAVAAAGGTAKLDPLALLPFAEQRARAQLADAALVGISCFPVRDDGTADLSLVDNGLCSYSFRSPQATRSHPDVPVGIRAEARCMVSFSVQRRLDVAAYVTGHSRGDCRRSHLVAPPACTFADVWKRALAAGAPAGAVATIHLAARYRSPYDPPDPADEPDTVERGLWQLRIERDDGPNVRFDTWDDCGATPPTAEEKRVAAAVAGLRPALRACFAKAAGRHDSVEAFELVWRLGVDRTGSTSVTYTDTGVDIEGFFQGSLGQVRTRFADCARPAFTRLRLPPALGAVRLVIRIERDGRPQLAPPPYQEPPTYRRLPAEAVEVAPGPPRPD
jgi:hypothetical protein